MAGASGRPRGRPRKNPVAPPAAAPVNAFARVSKQATATEKAVADITPISPSARKRKAARSPEPEEVAATPSQRKTLSTKSKSNKKARLQISEPLSQIQEPSTPRPKSTRKRALSPTLEESPRTKEAGNLFKRLRIASTPTVATRKFSPLATALVTDTTNTNTPATSVLDDSSDDNDVDSSAGTTPEPEQQQQQQQQQEPLPQGLLDLVSLYAAFLRTIVLHYAHNGTNTPVDLRQLSQPVSIAWGKRRISLADVRRCVGIMDTSGASPFFLADYGSKKVCVELREAHHGMCLDEPGLLAIFDGNLRRLWEDVKEAAADNIAGFVLGLPKAAVQSCESAVKASTLFGKGQRAMEELKKGVAAKKNAQEAAKAASQGTITNADGTPGPKLSLLERLRLKEEQLTRLAATGPTAAELERQAALQRASDIAAVIAMLAKSAASAGTGGRVSFTVAVLLQKLKDSLRLPISKEEGTTCVRLLASEVAPEWLRIVTIGNKENVVITVPRAPSSSSVAERVKMLSVGGS
ncbi:unnamed protein product [Discula destructiva]